MNALVKTAIDRIEDASLQLADALNNAGNKRGRLDDAKYALTNAEYSHILDGLEGKNADERNARLAHMTAPLREAVQKAMADDREASAILEMARAKLRSAHVIAHLLTGNLGTDDAENL